MNNGVWNNLPNELFIIGDIHGDFYALKHALLKTSCVMFDEINKEKLIKTKGNEIHLLDGCDHYYVTNKKISWNPNKINSFIVFVGDLIDRCRLVNNNNCYHAVNDENCDYKILRLLLDLDIEAQKYQSRVIIVLGNHEIMNLQENFKYVSIKGLADINRNQNIVNLLQQNIDKLYGIIRIQNYLICHGGINPDFIEKNYYFFDKNKEFTEHYNIYIKKFLLTRENSNLIENINGPLWDRTNGLDDKALSDIQCEKIFKFNLLNIDSNFLPNLKIIVAHCPQVYNISKYGINLIQCGNFKNKIWRVDISMSRAFDNYITDIDSLNQLLDKLNMFITTNLNPPNILEFYKYREKEYTCVQLLKISNNTKEEIIYGTTSLDFFYNDVFENKIYHKYLYLLQDMFTYYSNIIQSISLEENNDYKLIIDKIIKIKTKFQTKIYGTNQILTYDIIYD